MYVSKVSSEGNNGQLSEIISLCTFEESATSRVISLSWGHNILINLFLLVVVVVGEGMQNCFLNTNSNMETNGGLTINFYRIKFSFTHILRESRRFRAFLGVFC